MIFLVHYDRVSQRLVEIRSFQDCDRKFAAQQRIDLEIQLLGDGGYQEVVLLEAASEQDLRATHRRYFESLNQIGKVRGD